MHTKVSFRLLCNFSGLPRAPGPRMLTGPASFGPVSTRRFESNRGRPVALDGGGADSRGCASYGSTLSVRLTGNTLG